MSEKPDNAQRTEEPTAKRLADARKDGDSPKSQEILAAVMLAAGALGVWLFGGDVAMQLARLGGGVIGEAHSISVDPAGLRRLFVTLAISAGLALGGLGVVIFAAAFLGNVGQAAPVIAPKKIKPSLDRISPAAGVKRILGPQGLFNFAKGVAKIILVGTILGFAIWPRKDLLAQSLSMNAAQLLGAVQGLVLLLVGLAAIVMIVLAAGDYAFQRHQWRQRLRMTREEVRREQKETEGDPQIRARQRQARETLARSRMMQAVENATVLIMNPTHYAVALDYESGSADAPVCVAKGVDELALRMREIARENNVPVIENPPLARTLHATTEVGEHIPIDQYEAVAKIISFIMSKGRPAPRPN